MGFGIAWMCVVAAEMMPGASTGLGYLIMYAYGWGQIQVVMAGMVVIGLIGLAIDLVFKSVEVKWFSWRRLDKMRLEVDRLEGVPQGKGRDC